MLFRSNYTVTDSRGCSASNSVTVGQPAALTANASATPIACFGGSSTVTVTAAGGTAPYTGTGTYSRTAGAYSYTVRDANNCATSVSGTITQPTQLTASNVVGAAIACFGGSTTVTVSATGGTTPYNGTGTFTRGAGAFTYTVTDANGCTAATSGSLTQPATGVSAAVQIGTIACYGGTTTVKITPTGGTSPYTGGGT